jgi:hypothetical protein
MRGNYSVKVKRMSRLNIRTVYSPWYRVQSTPNDVLLTESYFPVLLDFNLQISSELDVEVLLTPFYHWYL